MRKLTVRAIAAAIGVASFAAGSSARAQSTLLASSGYWQAQSSIVDGRAVCAVMSRAPDRVLGISIAANEKTMTLRAYKPSWQIPTTTLTVPMNFSFDGFPAWKVIYAAPMLDGHGVIYDIVPEFARAFVHAVTASSAMTVNFGGTEAPWTFNLAGTTGEWPAFMDCAKRVNPDVVAQLAPLAATQPYAQSPAMQPYAAAPPATQPHTAPVQSQPYVPAASGLRV